MDLPALGTGRGQRRAKLGQLAEVAAIALAGKDGAVGFFEVGAIADW